MNIRIALWVFIVTLLSYNVFSLDSAIEPSGAKLMHDAGITGEGNTICLIDGGLYYQHTNLGGCVGESCKILATHKISDGSPNIDSDNHGTWTAGVIISDHNKYKGIAYGANLVFVQVSTYNEIKDAIEWCVDNKDNYNISIISMSMSRHENQANTDCLCQNLNCGSSPFTYDYDNIVPQLAYARANGVITLFSAGNQYQGSGVSDGTPVTESANYPACLANATAIASVSDEDEMSSFSNRKNFVEIVAPGENIITTHTDGDFYFLTESRIKKFLCKFNLANCGISGTSFSTPYIAGSVALIREFDPAIKEPSYIERLLETYGEEVCDSKSNKCYSRIDFPSLFGIYDWPMYHHDLRRTGFTLLKGDLTKSDDEQSSWTLDSAVDPGAFDFPSIADIDADGKMEILTATSITQGGSSTNWEGRFYVLNCKERNNKCRDFTEKWKFVKTDFTIGKAPSIDDIDDDNIKEVVFAGFPTFEAANDGTVYAFKANKRGKLNRNDASYTYDLPLEPEQGGGFYGEIGQTAIADIDLKDDKEVLVADYEGILNWQAYMYILEPSSGRKFNLQEKIPIGPKALSGGAKGAIAVANIDSDDYPEIIVPASFGIYVYEYDGNNIVKKWNNSDAFIYHTAVIADVDADNEYEIVYLTHNDNGFSACTSGVTCTDELHIVNAIYRSHDSKIQVPVGKTSHLLVTHPIEFITTIGRVNRRLMPNIAPFATCLDTSYNPPYITFAAALKQHAIQGHEQTNSRMNTLSNIRQNGLFIVNVPGKDLLPLLDTIAYPYQRKDLEDKIKKAGLTKVEPFVLSENDTYPPLIGECLAHLECETVDIHRPKKSDHYLITGKVVGASYDESLGENDEVRLNLARKIFHHFGADSENPSMRYIGFIQPDSTKTITFKLEEKIK